MTCTETQKLAIDTVLEGKVTEAQEAGASVVLVKYGDIFRVEFAEDPSVNVARLQVILKEGSIPFMVKFRRYPPLHED